MIPKPAGRQKKSRGLRQAGAGLLPASSIQTLGESKAKVNSTCGQLYFAAKNPRSRSGAELPHTVPSVPQPFPEPHLRYSLDAFQEPACPNLFVVSGILASARQGPPATLRGEP